jgi:hypothetical protein
VTVSFSFIFLLRRFQPFIESILFYHSYI